MKVLWVTSCARDMWDASGANLVRSFEETNTEGTLLVCHEKMLMGTPKNWPKIQTYNLDTDSFLQNWLKENAEFIPEHLGGTAKEPLCKCKGGPYDPHHKAHKMPCLGQWFNKNHSRWFRKIASLKYALETLCHPVEVSGEGTRSLPSPYDAIVWLDSDCAFKTRVVGRHVLGWFKGSNGVFYCKYTRPVLEAGVVGYQLARGGGDVIDRLVTLFATGEYRNLSRWDDCYTLQKIMPLTGVKHVDVAYAVGDHAAVIEHSALGAFIRHDKGKHGRGLGIMT